MLFFNTKAKRAKELADHLLTHAELLSDALLAAFNANPTEKYRKAFMIESLLLFLHLVGRIGDRELNNSQNNGLMNLLARTIADDMVTSVKKKERDIASSDFFDSFDRTEVEYSGCTEGFLENNPFSEKALFSKFAKRVVNRKNTIQSEKDTPEEISQLRSDMSTVLDILLKLYPEMNLEHHVIHVGNSF